MDKTLLQNLLGVMRCYRGRLLFASILLLVANVLLISNPLILRMAIIRGGSPWIWASLLAAVAFLSSLLRYQMRVEFNKVSRVVERDMRSALFERIQKQSMEFYDRHGVGELIERLSSDMNAYRDVLGPGLLFPVYFITTVLPGIMALFWISSLMGTLALIPVFIIPLLNLAVRRDIYSSSKAVQEKLAEMANFVQEDFSSIRTVKSYAAEKHLYAYFSLLCNEFFTLNFRLMCLQGWFFPLLILVTRIITIILVLAAGLLFLNPADFVAFMWIQSYIFFPVVVMGWVIPIWQQGRASYDRLREIFEEPIAVKDVSNGSLRIPAGADIRFHHLTFAYPGHEPTLLNIDLTIKGGSLVGLTGPTGAGKSTLFKLLNREYEIPRGVISIGGKDIHDYPLSAFWQEIISVDQIPFLFSKSIRDNVRFGRQSATEEEIYWASELAALHETVKEFEEGYDTLVGEKGVMLSGGQKSRVAIARAFLVNRSILLLDDIFASVDNHTALHIFNSVKKTFKGRTIILMTSKISLLEKMDRVLFMMKGKIVEDGSPNELLAKKGKFFALKELGKIIDV